MSNAERLKRRIAIANGDAITGGGQALEAVHRPQLA
jgi:hypothetical protein